MEGRQTMTPWKLFDKLPSWRGGKKRKKEKESDNAHPHPSLLTYRYLRT